jgi:triphosphatase
MVEPISREIELKLHVGPDDLATLRDHPGLALYRAGAPRVQHLVTTYYDTPDHRLALSGLALRVRQVGRRRTQTVKTRERAEHGQSAGAAIRREWEWPVADGRPNLAVLDDIGFGAALRAADRAAIEPIFATDITRTRVELDAGAGTRIELALDRGVLRAGALRHPISELELELLSDGDAAGLARLYEIALVLHAGTPLQIGTESKADVGYALITQRPPLPHKAHPVTFEAEFSAAQVFGRLVRGCIGHLLDNQHCALNGCDVGGIHQMRVALRRLRAAFSLFGESLALSGLAPLKDEVRWLAGELSPARDWDVFVKEMLPGGKDKSAGAVRRVRRHAEAARADAGRRAEAAIRAPRYTALILTLGLWIEQERWRPQGEAERAAAEQPIGALAAGILDRRLRKVRKAGKHLARLSIEQRHMLRKALKTLRYGAAFLAGLYPAGRARRYLDAMAGLQDVLGALNDLAVAQGLASSLCDPSDRALAGGVSRLEAIFAKRLAGRVEALQPAWRAFRSAEPFWR